MYKKSLRGVILNKLVATRILYDVSDKTKKYNVHVFVPNLIADGSYECEIQIENAPDGLNHIAVGGVDSYQALLLAIKTLHTMVEVFNKKFLKSKLRWQDDANFDLGFSISTDS
jgi:hypothetical protein